MFGGTPGDLPDPFLHTLIQRILIEQVLTGVAGHGHLRENDHVHLLRIGFRDIITNVLGIFTHIAHLHSRHGAGNSNKVQHRNSSQRKLIGIS